MKLCFSTLGCPDWTWKEIFATAKDLGYNGIEIRGMGDELSAPNMSAFSDQQLPATLRSLSASGLSIPILTSGACLGLAETVGHMEEAKAYIDLASKMGVPYVRVMITSRPEPIGANVEQARHLYRRLCDYAAGKNVAVLIETSGELAKPEVLEPFMADVSAQSAGILWDVHHPHRFFGESPEAVWQTLGAWVKHIHLSDSVMENGQVRYRMIGYGDVPIPEIAAILYKNGYTGFISLEWKKRWQPDLEEPGIVFAHFKNYMDYLLQSL
jgi:fatty-acyl-CoA synthase